jgi:hypothetical protein
MILQGACKIKIVSLFYHTVIIALSDTKESQTAYVVNLQDHRRLPSIPWGVTWIPEVVQ